VIQTRHALELYITGLAKALYTRGFEIPSHPTAEIDPDGTVAFSIVGAIPEPDSAVTSEIDLDEVWRPAHDDQLRRDAYAYELIDRPRGRRRAFHMHDRDAATALFGTGVHEHCEEVLGHSACDHYLGRELPNGYLAIELLIAAWLEPGQLDCSSLICLDR
jgi:hypothetical protein